MSSEYFEMHSMIFKIGKALFSVSKRNLSQFGEVIVCQTRDVQRGGHIIPTGTDTEFHTLMKAHQRKHFDHYFQASTEHIFRKLHFQLESGEALESD